MSTTGAANTTTSGLTTAPADGLVVWAVVVACIVGAALIAAVIVLVCWLRNRVPKKDRYPKKSDEGYEVARPEAHFKGMPWDKAPAAGE